MTVDAHTAGFRLLTALSKHAASPGYLRKLQYIVVLLQVRARNLLARMLTCFGVYEVLTVAARSCCRFR